MTRARNISNPQAVTLPLTVSANITSNASLAIGNTTITGNQFVNGAVTFANSSANNIFFNTDGTVSIGTSNNVSSRKLQAVGQIAAVTANGYVVVELDADPAANVGYIGTKSNTAVYIKTNDAGRFYVAANGNVGVGNSTPATKMHVAGSITLDNNQAIRTDNGIWMIGSTSSEISIGSQSANTSRTIGLYPSANSTPAILCTTAGNVGIGPTSPTTKLHISGNGNFIAVDNYKEATSSANGAQIRLNSSGTYWGWIFSTSAQKAALGYGVQTNPTSEVLTWDFSNGGIVNMPNQPVFDAYKTGGFVTGTSTIVFNSTLVNNGNYYNTSTGFFTAPIAGNYHFFFNANIQGTSGSNIYVTIRKNGTSVGGAYNTYPGSTSYWVNLAGSWNITLAKNDTISMTMQYADNRMDYWNEAISHFGGHLLG
jgi:hypothetical protein